MMPSCPRDPALFSTYSIFFCGAGSGQVVQVVPMLLTQPTPSRSDLAAPPAAAAPGAARRKTRSRFTRG